MPPEVSVVIAARDAESTIAATLDGLAAQVGAPTHEIVVVDNGSVDATAEIVAAHPLDVRLVLRARGAGPGAARNDGASLARGRVVAFTDADCAPEPGWLAAGLAELEVAGADIVQGRVLPVAGVPVGPFDRTLGVVSEYGLYETANLFVRREWLGRVGGFRDLLDGRRPFGEDTVLVWSARRAGARTAFADQALVHHAVFPGTPRDYLRERRRDGLFTDLTAQVPELRRAFLYRRLFLNRRSAAFDLAVLGGLVGLMPRSRAAMLLAVPWLALVAGETRRRTGRRDVPAAAVVATGDVLAAVSLVRGSVRNRTPVL